MIRWCGLVLTGLVTVTGFTESALAQAYKCSQVPPAGPSLFWPSRLQSYAVHERGSDDVDDGSEFEAVERSFDTWQQVACSDFAFLGERTSARLIGYDWRTPEDNENLVIWRNGDADDPVDQWHHEYGSIAMTTTTFNSRTGELLDADIELNGVRFPFSACDPGSPGCLVDYDVQNTVTHEIGHVLGLDHPDPAQPGASETTMFASAPRGEVKKRDLHPEDIEGMCFIYPIGAPVGRCPDEQPQEGPYPVITQVGCTASERPTSVCAMGWFDVAVLGMMWLCGRGRKKGRPAER